MVNLNSNSAYSHGPGDNDLEGLLGTHQPTPSGLKRLSASLRAAPGQHGKFPWRGVTWRFATAALTSIQIMALLYSFARRESLTTWERRAFNAFIILFSGLLSLTLGSLLGLLGSVLRWRILARVRTTPHDVDLILGMANPTGAFKVVWHHAVGRGKWSATSGIVLGYLVVNIIGRLSVAAFGLTYDLNENAGVEYPPKVTDFGSSNWVNGNDSVRNMRRMTEYALPGFWLVPTEYNISDPSTYTTTNISGSGLDRKVDGNKLTYSYSLKEYRGIESSSSTDKVVHSSSTCIGRTYFKDVTGAELVYQGGKLLEKPDDGAPVPEYLQAVQNMGDDTICRWGTKWKDSANASAAGSSCDTTYLLRYTDNNVTAKATFYECNVCLGDQTDKAQLSSDAFHGFPAENASYAASMLLRFAAFEPLDALDLLEALFTLFLSLFTDDSSDAASDDYYSKKGYACLDSDMDFMSGIAALSLDKDGADWLKTPVPAEYELHAAHLAARVPILAIIGAEQLLPKVLKEQGASERPYITTSLEVKWGRSFGVLGTILAGQLLAVAVVFYTARGVVLRDHDSYLSVARLLRTAVNSLGKDVTGSGSTESGEELARRIQENGGVKQRNIKYGTKRVSKQGSPEVVVVDLWHDVDEDFEKVKLLLSRD
ncbi:hypothetical protein B0H67DRAFT_648009 [Lasiosphaeris hirsuta]|uniref:Uncharacterized protein n=1 Tax=Lasiosphaeris hirsuta TaxID=260670 RepID=A0AA40A225_9PEZI|nr:hypothetical protein B0H67DRAFT_648009 [Lasiosphaeris hirsuta]